MSDLTQALVPGGRWGQAGFVAGAIALSLLIGLAVGNPTSELRLMAGALVAMVLWAVVLVRPRIGLLGLAASVIALLVFEIADERGANLLDILIIPTILGAILYRDRHGAAEHLESGAEHERMRAATRRLGRWVAAYLALAAISLVPMAMRMGAANAVDSGLVLGRGIQGLLLFPLGLELLRSRRDVRAAIVTLFTGATVFAVFNSIGLIFADVKRAGITWVVNRADWPIESPNEGGAGMVVIWALLAARQATQHRRLNLLWMAIALVMLVLTQSRSGLLAWFTFVLLSWRGFSWPKLFAAGAATTAIPLIPNDWLTRMTRTLALERGSFETFSILVRVYGYQAAWRVFMDNPIFGVGYMGFRFISDRYNDLNFVMVTAENFFLETAVSMGVIGLVVVIVVFVMLFRLGLEARRIAPKGTFAHNMARMHVPLAAGITVANMTGDHFVGMVGLGQMAIWCAILVRATHVAIAEQNA